MLQMTLLLVISKWGVLPTQTHVHDSRCCKRLFSSPSARGSLTYLNSSALLQMLQTTFLLPVSKGGVLPTQILVMTPNVSNDLSSAHQQEESLTTQSLEHDSKCCKLFFSSPSARGSVTYLNSSALLQILQTTFLLPISKRRVKPIQILQSTFLRLISKGKQVLPTQTLVHNSKCCKLFFSCPSARAESYPSNLKCMTTHVENDFSLAH